MSDRYSWMIRAGFDNGDEEEKGWYDDEETASEAFGDFDLEDGDRPYDWAELVKVDWYMHCDSVIDGIAREDVR